MTLKSLRHPQAPIDEWNHTQEEIEEFQDAEGEASGKVGLLNFFSMSLGIPDILLGM